MRPKKYLTDIERKAAIKKCKREYADKNYLKGLTTRGTEFKQGIGGWNKDAKIQALKDMKENKEKLYFYALIRSPQYVCRFLEEIKPYVIYTGI